MRQKLFRVYIDESGGRHLSKRSDDHFVLSAVITFDDFDRAVREDFRKLKVTLGRKPDHKLHFTKLRPHERMQAAEGVATLPLATITSTIIHKPGLWRLNAEGTFERAFIASPDPMYLYALRLLLERVSFFVKRQTGTQVTVTFAHVRGLSPPLVYEYRRRLEALPGVRIDWSLFGGEFRVAGQRQIELLQVADTTAAATYHAVEPAESGQVRPEWLRALRGKLFRGGANADWPLTSYGLKVFPPSAREPGGHLNWLDRL